jgi:muconolactone delta-isomerase
MKFFTSNGGGGMNFLVLWELELGILQPAVIKAVARMPEYGNNLKDTGKLHSRYHMVGRHGGAWIYEMDCDEELERLLAASPVYNYARYQVFPLADMEALEDILK